MVHAPGVISASLKSPLASVRVVRMRSPCVARTVAPGNGCPSDFTVPDCACASENEPTKRATPASTRIYNDWMPDRDPQVTSSNVTIKHAQKWILAETESASVTALAAALGVSMPVARVLCARGLNSIEGARRFLAPSFND